VTAVGATALAAAGSLWLAAAMLGPLAARRVGLRAVAVVSALGGLAAGIGGVTVAVAGVRDQWTLGAGNLVGSLTLRLEPLAGVFLVLLGLVAVAIAWFGPRYHSPALAPPRTCAPCSSRCWRPWPCWSPGTGWSSWSPGSR